MYKQFSLFQIVRKPFASNLLLHLSAARRKACASLANDDPVSSSVIVDTRELSALAVQTAGTTGDKIADQLIIEHHQYASEPQVPFLGFFTTMSLTRIRYSARNPMFLPSSFSLFLS